VRSQAGDDRLDDIGRDRRVGLRDVKDQDDAGLRAADQMVSPTTQARDRSSGTRRTCVMWSRT
jgi:hypothetical protein